MKTSILDRNDPRRNEYLGLVRRRVAAGSFTNADVEKWKAELGDVVADIVQDLAPKKKKKAAPRKTAPTTEPVEPEKE